MALLPPIHQPDGERPSHDDYVPGLEWIPRTWTSFSIETPPRLLFGNQRYWGNFYNGQRLSDSPIPSPVWGPKPIPRPGEWQFSLVPISISNWGIIVLPYFAFKTKSGLHFRMGARWSDDEGFNYVTFPSLAVKMFKV